MHPYLALHDFSVRLYLGKIMEVRMDWWVLKSKRVEAERLLFC